MTALPQLLLEKLASILSAESLQAAMDARTQPRRIALRVNTLRCDTTSALAALARSGVRTRAVQWMRDALIVEQGTMDQVQSCPTLSSGACHIQSLSSIAVGHALAPAPGTRVLDACAAPGSKTTHLAALMNNQGVLTAADASRTRMFRLRAVLDKLGARADTVVERAERWGRRAPASYHAVLVDAPCSAEGRALAGDEDAAADWSPRKCKRLASEQKAILHSAIEACLPGGVLVYSTCTLGSEENEMVLARALELYAGRVALEPLPLEIPGALPGRTQWEKHSFPSELVHARRIVPLPATVHPDGPWLDGFFIARLRKLH